MPNEFPIPETSFPSFNYSKVSVSLAQQGGHTKTRRGQYWNRAVAKVKQGGGNTETRRWQNWNKAGAILKQDGGKTKTRRWRYKNKVVTMLKQRGCNTSTKGHIMLPNLGNQLITELAPMPIQSIICNVRLCVRLIVCPSSNPPSLRGCPRHKG